MMPAARIAGSTSGSVTRRVSVNRLAPRMLAASSISLETISRALDVKTTA